MTLDFGEQNALLDRGDFNQMIGRLLVKYALNTLKAAAAAPGSVPAEKVELAKTIEKNYMQYLPRVVNFVALLSDEVFPDLDSADQVVEGMRDNSLLERIYQLFDASWNLFRSEVESQAQPQPQPQPQPAPTTTVKASTTTTTPTTTLPKLG